ncbi:S8 family serine peptidase [Haladaptatus sp. GCM10025707]|uniref:S8 family serine peptidase n=1 Tax=unclassified Haladaptatus TaxID=2622732 RepID=UPI0023E7B9D3|nr:MULTISPECIES: S8 family serine peptidase [unclassified Haladaptatus]
MVDTSRRRFLKASGLLVGGIAASPTASATESTDRFIVESKNLRDADFEDAALTVVHPLDALDYTVVSGTESAVADLGVKYEPDLVYELDLPVTATEAADEPGYPLQWDKQVQDIPAVHDVTRGEGTRVAVIDSGVSASHPDLQHAVNVDLSRNFTGDGYGAGRAVGGGHGTHVAGIIAANDQNDVGVTGSAPATEIVDCRVFSTGPSASFADILAALVYAGEIGCDAANMSLGAYPVSRQANGEFYGKVLNNTTSYVSNQLGTLIVASAGNDAADLQHDGSVISLPNEAANIMSISATGPIGYMWGEEGLREEFVSPAFYTNYGTNAVDLGAPGGDADTDAIDTGVPWFYDLVYNTYTVPTYDEASNSFTFENTYSWLAGTSMAAPQVAAAAALVKSVNQDYSATQVRDTLEDTASVPEGQDKAYYGAGFLDPLAAVLN